jgi:hypothetical protein
MVIELRNHRVSLHQPFVVVDPQSFNLFAREIEVKDVPYLYV